MYNVLYRRVTKTVRTTKWNWNKTVYRHPNRNRNCIACCRVIRLRSLTCSSLFLHHIESLAIFITHCTTAYKNAVDWSNCCSLLKFKAHRGQIQSKFNNYEYMYSKRGPKCTVHTPSHYLLCVLFAGCLSFTVRVSADGEEAGHYTFISLCCSTCSRQRILSDVVNQVILRTFTSYATYHWATRDVALSSSAVVNRLNHSFFTLFR